MEKKKIMIFDKNFNINKSLQMQDYFKKYWYLFKQQYTTPYDPHYPTLYHYTSLSTLFDILESDSFWLSGIRFSNDASEEKILGQNWLRKKNYTGDNFILCLSREGNSLSQWRGYCPVGGASIGMYSEGLETYSILNADYNTSKKHIDVLSVPIPVIYLFSQNSSDEDQDPQLTAIDIMKKIMKFRDENIQKYVLLNDTDFIPFIKHKAFFEEHEHRIIISNSNGELSNCIRFRNLKNGTKIPYIVIKNGCTDEAHDYPFNITDENIEILAGSLLMNTYPIILPVCNNQSNLYFKMKEFIEKKSEERTAKKPIICTGHLPIKNITISPMPDQNRIVEQVKRFCQSKYWLKDVKVSGSNIPYVSSINNYS